MPFKSILVLCVLLQTHLVLIYILPTNSDILCIYRLAMEEEGLASKQVKPIGFEEPRGGAYNNQKHLKLETPCS